MVTSGIVPSGHSTLTSQRTLLSSRMLLYYAPLSIVTILLLALRTPVAATASKPAFRVKMLDMPPMFEPSQVTIKAGESVEWQNVGNEVHHATSDPSLAIKRTDVTNPPGVEPFDSGFLRPGETFAHTFLKRGVYKYTCVVHEGKGMIGEVVVR
jgi:plastocyanin